MRGFARLRRYRRAKVPECVRTHNCKGGAVADTYTGYCVKCREKRDFDGNVEETNGRRMAKGTCPVCGTKMTRILGKAKV